MTQDFMIRSTVHCSTKKLEKALRFERKSLDKKMHQILKKSLDKKDTTF